MNFVEIVAQIRKDRRAQEAQDVLKIRSAQSDQQSTSTSSYRKHGQVHQMVKNDVILRHFRELQSEGARFVVPGLSAVQHGEESEGIEDEAERIREE
jgi:hypothetical protein